MVTTSLENIIVGLRQVLLTESEKVLEIKQFVINDKWLFDDSKMNTSQWEAIANVMLAYRHLEDARMRLWKVMQVIQWWISKYNYDPRKNNSPSTWLLIDTIPILSSNYK